MLWWRGGATYCLVQVCATGRVLSRAKAFTDVLFGGDGGGSLVAPFFLLGHHFEAPCPLLHGALEGENYVHLWTCDGGAIGVVPSLEAPHLETRFGYAVVVVGWWCCLCATAEEARVVRAGREVQRAHGCWRP